MLSDKEARQHRYRRFEVVFSTLVGVVVGVGIGSVAVLSSGSWIFALIPILALLARLVAVVRGKPWALDRVVWLWPVLALVVAVATFALMPPDVAPFGLVFAVVAWFVVGVVGGILEVALDRDGTLARPW